MRRRDFLVRSGTVLAALAASGAASELLASPAWADTGGYPYANYDGPGSNPSQWIWTDSTGNMYSPYGFAYRNCTDFVAWKLNSANGLAFKDSASTGLYGSAKDWKTRAVAEGYTVDMTPAVGAVAWFNSNAYGASSYGHVGWVSSISSDGKTVTIEEYNYSVVGGYDTRSFASGNVSGYIHFKDLSAPSNPPPPPPTIIAVKKRTFGSAQQAWTATDSTVYVDAWWPGSNGIVQQKVYTAKTNEKIVDFDKINQPDGVTQSLYVATTATDGSGAGGVYEIWWDGNGFSNPAELVTRGNIRKVVADLKQEGSTLTHRLYVLAQDGPYEYWWQSGTGVSNGALLWNINNGIAIVKSVAPNGDDEVFVATNGYVYQMQWSGSGVIVRHQVTALADTVDIDKMTLNDTELLYTFTATGVCETWWKYDPATGTFGGYSNPAKIITVPSGETVVAGLKRMDGTTHQVYVATKGHVYQYWWNSTSGGVVSGAPLCTVTQNDIIGIDESVDPNDTAIEQLYTAHESFVYETWWGDGSVHTSTVVSLTS